MGPSPQPDSPMRGLSHRALLLVSAVLALAGLLSLWFAAPVRPVGFPLDDAWIHLVYARSVAQDVVLGYEPGVPGTGCTAPAWALLLAVVHAALGWAGTDAVVWGVRLAGAAFFVGTVVVAALLVRARTRNPWPAVLTAVLLSFASALAMAALSGMEVLACAFGMVAALYALEQQAPLAMGCAMAWACACRPEAAPAMIALGLIAVAQLPRTPVVLAKLVLPSVLVGALLVEHNLRASGHPLPATFYLKQHFSVAALPDRLLQVVRDVLGETGPFVGHAIWFGGVGLVTRRTPWADRWPLLVGAVFLLSAVAVTDPKHGMGFYFGRYFYPALPLLVVGLVLGGVHVVAQLPPRWKPGVLALAALFVAPGLVLGRSVHGYHLHNDTRNINEVQVQMGRDLATLLPPGARVGVSDAGAVRYFSGHPAVDLVGLNNFELVEHTDEFLRTHPVTHLAIMPLWGVPTPGAPVQLVRAYETEDYSVVRVTRQEVQWLLVCTGQGMVRLGKRFAVQCDPAAHD